MSFAPRQTRNSNKTSPIPQPSNIKLNIKPAAKPVRPKPKRDNKTKVFPSKQPNMTQTKSSNLSVSSPSNDVLPNCSIPKPASVDSLDAGSNIFTDEERILEQLSVDSADLPPQFAKLAQVIVRAVLSCTDAKLEAERKRHNAEMDALRLKVQELEVERDFLENYGRRNTIVISGPDILPTRTHEDCYTSVIDIVSSKTGVKIDRNDIDVCHRLPIPKSNDPNKQLDGTKKPIIVKFVRRDTKHTILRACKNKKPKNIYFNESLSSTRQKILYVVRKVKANHPSIIASYKTEDCNIRVFSPTPGDPTRFAMTTLNTRQQLDRFLLTKLGFGSSHILDENKWTEKRNISHAQPPHPTGLII